MSGPFIPRLHAPELFTSGGVRKTDPVTSHAAASRVRPKPTRDLILSALGRYPDGLNGSELAAATGKRLNTVTPRFAELKKASLIKIAGQDTRTAETRDGQFVYVLTPLGRTARDMIALADH